MPSENELGAAVQFPAAFHNCFGQLPRRAGRVDGITVQDFFINWQTCGHVIGMSLATHEDGVACDPHTHRGANEYFYVVSGQWDITVDGQSIPVKPGDVVFVPAGYLHSVEADLGPEGGAKLLCIMVVAPGHEGDLTPWAPVAAAPAPAPEA